MATVLTLAPAFASRTAINDLFRGDVVRGHTVIPIPYNNWSVAPWDLGHGSFLLNNYLHGFTGPFIVFAYGLGTRVASDWLREYGPTSDIDPEDVQFILVGDAFRKYGGALYDASENGVPDDTPYDVTNFCRQYDGWADWPNAPNAYLNIAAINNATTGLTVVHTDYRNYSLDDPRCLTYQDTVGGSPGNIKYVWLPTYPLPVLEGWSWWPQYQREQDQRMRPGIEAGYRRPVLLDLYSPELAASRRMELSLIQERVERERNYRG